MANNKAKILLALMILVMNSCSSTPPPQDNPPTEMIATTAETPILETNTPESTPVIPRTASETATPTGESGNTGQITSTSTGTEVNILPSATAPLISRCNLARYIADVTIPDGTVIKPGGKFIKTWKIMNTGDCQWSASYALGFGYGEPLGGSETKIDQIVKPGATIDISIRMVAPKEEGWYAGWWRMKSETGVYFGEFVFVSIQVKKE
jgi:hypothetical protein